jgi:hypothetical protein
MEMVIYGYVTPETLAGWGLHPQGTRLLISAAPDAFDKIQATLRQDGVAVHTFDAKPEAVYGHQFQIDAILAMLAAVAVILAALCVVLVFDLVNSLMTAERRTIGTLRAIGAGPRQIGFDYLAGVGLLGLAAGLIALAPAVQGGEALAGFILRLLNFNALSHAPLWLLPALPAGSAAFAALIALIRVRPALALPVRDALSRGALARRPRSGFPPGRYPAARAAAPPTPAAHGGLDAGPQTLAYVAHRHHPVARPDLLHDGADLAQFHAANAGADPQSQRFRHCGGDAQ